MDKQVWIAVLGCCIALSGCDASKGALEGLSRALKQETSQVAAAKIAVTSQLKDPQSAQFQNIIEFPEGVVCGEMNAKNGMGGYVGFKPFVYRPVASTGLLYADLKASEADIKQWCNDTPNKVLTDLAAKQAKWDELCRGSKASVGTSMSELRAKLSSQGEAGKAGLDALNAAEAAVQDSSCGFAEKAKKELDSYQARNK